MKEEKNVTKKVTEEAEKLIEGILEEGIQASNVDFLYKIVDIHKDIANEEYWQKKEEGINMRYKAYGRDSYGEEYGNYGRYGEYSEGSYGRRGVPGTGRRYSEGSYGRRGVPGTGRGRYRGEEMMNEMAYHYGNYSESSQYGAEHESTKALEAMMEATVDFIKMLKEDAKSPEEMEIIKHYSKKISEM